MKNLYEINSVPDKEFDKGVIFDTMGNSTFAITYDFARKTTLISVENEQQAKNLASSVPGLGLDRKGSAITGNLTAFSIYRKADTVDEKIFADVFDLDIKHGSLSVVFRPIRSAELAHSKAFIEKTLSGRESKETTSILNEVFSKRVNTSLQKENFDRSEELLYLTEVLESINRSILRNGLAYKVHLIASEDDGSIEEYIRSRFLVISKSQIRVIEDVARLRALPVGADIAKKLLSFRGFYRLSYSLPTAYARQNGDLVFGTFMKDSVLPTENVLSIEKSTLNLGSILIGLPGSGKTNEAMSIIDSLYLMHDRPKIAIISPTNEWNTFALSHGMYLVKLYDGKTPVNFFRCPNNNADRFYSDLAMILSSASNAGPYRNPMEKCMLNAFRRIYSSTKEPDPVDVYNEIEESLVKFHGKRTGGSVKYTKHGENIRSALENLRAILNRVEYAASDGVKFEEIVKGGVVFDISNASTSTKPYLYAMILNQIYAIGSEFDTNNDNNLNLLICLEEAQMIFKDKEAAAVQDLRYRIQDFRKQGIGLMLLTHNVNDIESSIRRLCQTKLYLKQAPDVAEIAAKDLTFTFAEDEDVVEKLKHLDSRIGAFNYVLKRGGDKLSQDTVFIRTKEYIAPAIKIPRETNTWKLPAVIKPKISVHGSAKENAVAVRIFYLGEEIAECKTANGVVLDPPELISSKKYLAHFIDKRGKASRSMKFKAERDISLTSD